MAPRFERVLLEKSADKVATIAINRPEQFNSFTNKMCKEFRRIWVKLAEDDEVNAVVLRATPGRAFSTGVDV